MMSEYLLLPLTALLLCGLILTIVWWYQTKTRNAGIVDAWWSYNFTFIILLYGLMGSGDGWKKIFMVVLVAVWSVRLGTHLLMRNIQHTEEDSRYRKLRLEYGPREKFLMWRFFMFQACSNVLLSVPFLFAVSSETPSLNGWWYAGGVLGLISWAGESLADAQLKKFKAYPENRGKVCRIGLWAYSRHPNYFFEWLMWVAFALVALDHPWGWIGLTSPALMYYILNHVTGIPMLEELAVQTKGKAYQDYQQTTSSFFPWFQK